MLSFKQFLLEDDDGYYYHITKGRNMPGIVEKGLTADGVKKNYRFSKKAVYLSDSPKHSEYFKNDIAELKKGEGK